MKKFLLASLLLAPPVQAQVIDCPKFYPWKDTPLAEVPYQHTGKGFLTKARLSGATMFAGDINGRGELHGDRRKVKGGWDIRYGFASGDARWMVCSYGGGGITWWEQLDAKATNCKLEVQEAGNDPMSARLTCK